MAYLPEGVFEKLALQIFAIKERMDIDKNSFSS
jgi:hypothetical protein